MYDLGEKIRQLRTERGLTQTQLAKKLNLSKSSISKYESGQKFPTLETLINIAALFHTSLDSLAGLEKGATISAAELTERQTAILNSLLIEFHKKKARRVIGLTPHQLDLINDILIEFQTPGEKP